MTFARDAAVKGDWWLSGPLDKPPLTIYAQAALLALIGTETLPNGVLTLNVHKGEFVGRLLAFFSSLTVIALTIRLTIDLTKQPLAAIVAGLTLAMVPLFRLYGASAFMDMPMIALALGALLAARRQQGSWSGVLLGLAICAKPQAALFAPLVGWYVLHARRHELLVRWIASMGSVLITLWLWDSLRPGDSVLLLGMANNNNFMLVTHLDALSARFREWLPAASSSHHLAGPNLFGGQALAWAAVVLVGLLSRPTRPLSLWLIACGLGHVLIFETLYERYLLPLAVVGVVSVWAAATRWLSARGHAAASWLPIVIIGLWLTLNADLSNHALQALEDDRHNSPIAHLADDLNALPVATVIYDHWLGWLLHYYMGPWHDKRIVYYPSPHDLVAGIQTLDERGPRYWLAPTDDPTRYGLSSAWSSDWRLWLSALEEAVTLEALHAYGHIRVFRIQP